MNRRFEFTLWVLVMVAGIHFLEEYALDLRSWLEYVLRVRVTWEQCHLVNAAVMLFAIGGAVIGWRVPELSMIMPGVFVLNALAFHIPFSFIWGRYSPGALTSGLLFVPAGLWAFVGARRDGVLSRRVLYCSIAGGVAWHLYLLAFHLIGPPR
jgi:uncharacterized protein with HXXEE motif